jgi:hypothetical protein
VTERLPPGSTPAVRRRSTARRIARRPTQRLTPKQTHAVELLFDAGGDATVHRVWGDLDRIGIASIGSTHHGARPHLSLAVCDDADPVRVAATIAREASGVPAPVVRVSHLGVFLHPVPILFLGVVATPELLHLHSRIQGAMKWTASTMWGQFREGRWVPNIAVAVRFDPALLSGGLGAVRGGIPSEFLGVRLHVVDIATRATVHAADLRVG